MTSIEYQATLRRIQRDAEESDYRIASVIVTLWCWVAIFGVAILCAEVLL